MPVRLLPGTIRTAQVSSSDAEVLLLSLQLGQVSHESADSDPEKYTLQVTEHISICIVSRMAMPFEGVFACLQQWSVPWEGRYMALTGYQNAGELRSSSDAAYETRAWKTTSRHSAVCLL